MKITRVTCCRFVLLLSLVAFAFSTTAPRAYAAGPGSTTVVTVQGQSAFATFDSFSPDGCIETLVEVLGTQSSRSPEADVFIDQFNSCTGTLLLVASGSTSNPTFQVGGNLNSASLSATISVFDYLSGNTLNVSVNTTWTATGPLTRNPESFNYHDKNSISNFHFNDASRDASASGTVSDGTTNFTPSPSVYGYIASFKDGYVTISLP